MGLKLHAVSQMLKLQGQASVSRDVFPPTPPGPEGSNGNGLLRVQWVSGAWLDSSFAQMSAKQTVIAAVAAVLVGLPAGWVVAMMLTPLLWRLEPVLKIELAGHSGPSDWIFYVVWAVTIPSLFFAIRRLLRNANA